MLTKHEAYTAPVVCAVYARDMSCPDVVRDAEFPLVVNPESVKFWGFVLIGFVAVVPSCVHPLAVNAPEKVKSSVNTCAHDTPGAISSTISQTQIRMAFSSFVFIKCKMFGLVDCFKVTTCQQPHGYQIVIL